MPVQRCRTCGDSLGADDLACPRCGLPAAPTLASPASATIHSALRIGLAVLIGLLGVVMMGLWVHPA